MTIVLADRSALEFLRRAPVRDAARVHLRFENTLAHEAFDAVASKPLPNEIEAALSRCGGILTSPVHLFVGSPKMRVSNRRVVSHTCTAKLPFGAFLDMGDGLFVASPELCFMRATASSHPARAVELGFELCGHYRLDRRESRGFIQAPPLASALQVETFVGAVCAARGAREARRLYHYVLDGARSPMESALAILLGFPTSRGGFDLGGFEINGRIDVPLSFRPMVGGKSYLLADMLWRDKRVILEYDGVLDHTGADRIASDAGRRNALEGLGYTVMTLTKRQLRHWDELQASFALLSRYLNKVERSNDPVKAALRRTLWQVVVPQNRSL